MDPAARHDLFASSVVGIDHTNGRYADVSLERCVRCAAVWLRYLVESEGRSHAGRWFRGLLTEALAATVTPTTAVALPESLPWHFYGGSYFQALGERTAARPLRVDD